MRKMFIYVLVLLMITVFTLSACVSDKVKPDTNQDQFVSTDEEPVIHEEINNTPKATPIPNDTGEQSTPKASSAPTSAIPASGSIVEVDREKTVGPFTPVSDLEKSRLNKRLTGLIDNSWPHNVEDYTNGIVAAGKVFILSERYRDEIFTGIKIGTSFDKIKTILGTPGWETDSILLYRSPSYYIMFQGNNAIHYAVLMASPPGLADPYALQSIITKLNSGNGLDLEKILAQVDPEGKFFDSTGYINGGGYYAHSQYGIVVIDFDEKYIEVYNNYEGQLYGWSHEGPTYEIRFINRDMNIDTMLIELNGYIEIEELFKNEAVISPDGKLSAIYEWIYSMDHHFIVRTLDYSMQDRKIYVASNSDFHWLNNSHLVYIDAYNELPYAVDVDFSAPSPINLLYEAGIIKERDPDFGKYKFEILGVENGRLSLRDVLNDSTYTLIVSEDAHGLIVKTNE